MKAPFALFLALSSALTCAVDSIVAAKSPRRPPAKPFLHPRFPNVAPPAPPACLLACVGQTAHGCSKEFNDFNCMCTANGKIVEQCLNNACPHGNAPKALVAFNEACKAQLKVARAPRIDAVKAVNSTTNVTISAVAPTFSVGPVVTTTPTKSSASGPVVVTITTQIVTTSTPEPTVLTLTTALILTSQSTTSSTLRFPVPSDTPPARLAKRDTDGALAAAQSVDSIAESALEQITGPRGQMDPNEMMTVSVAGSMAAAETVTESVTVTTSIGKTKKKKVSTTVATVTTTDASGITVAVEVTLTTKVKKNGGAPNALGSYSHTSWLVSLVLLLTDLLV